MEQMDKTEEEKLLRDNHHLKKYVEETEKKMGRPTFYGKVPRDVKDEEYPNVIYTTRGVVFIHIFKTKDMERPEYHAIAPILSGETKEKRDRILDLIYEKAHR